MSEIYFENKFYFNKKMAREYSSKILLKSSRFILNISSFICLVSAIINYYYYNYNIFNIYLFICCIFFLSASLFLPFYSSMKMIKNSKILNNNKIPETKVVFDNNNILLTEGNINMKFNYSQIIKIYNLKYLSILMINKKNGIIIDPNKFTKGNFDGFKKFINKKYK
ncbi:MAG: YcxB family protein [Oscillospiraceae bacterium]|nr:YcxB family protein [Oscillospiraceae bacterium]